MAIQHSEGCGSNYDHECNCPPGEWWRLRDRAEVAERRGSELDMLLRSQTARVTELEKMLASAVSALDSFEPLVSAARSIVREAEAMCDINDVERVVAIRKVVDRMRPLLAALPASPSVSKGKPDGSVPDLQHASVSTDAPVLPSVQPEPGSVSPDEGRRDGALRDDLGSEPSTPVRAPAPSTEVNRPSDAPSEDPWAWTCPDCGQVLDQSDKSTHPEKCPKTPQRSNEATPMHTCTGAVSGMRSQPCMACDRNFAATGDRFKSPEMADALRPTEATPDPRRAGAWRVGAKLGRTLYLDEQCVGMVDTPALASLIVAAASPQHPGDPTVRHVVAWMRQRYPENVHARSWADEIEHVFLGGVANRPDKATCMVCPDCLAAGHYAGLQHAILALDAGGVNPDGTRKTPRERVERLLTETLSLPSFVIHRSDSAPSTSDRKESS